MHTRWPEGGSPYRPSTPDGGAGKRQGGGKRGRKRQREETVPSCPPPSSQRLVAAPRMHKKAEANPQQQHNTMETAAATHTVIGTADCGMGTWHLAWVAKKRVRAILLQRTHLYYFEFTWPPENDPFSHAEIMHVLNYSDAVMRLAKLCPLQFPADRTKCVPLVESLLVDAMSPLLMNRDRHRDGTWKSYEFPTSFEDDGLKCWEDFGDDELTDELDEMD